MSVKRLVAKEAREGRKCEVGDRIVHRTHGPGRLLGKKRGHAVIELDAPHPELGRTFTTHLNNIKKLERHTQED